MINFLFFPQNLRGMQQATPGGPGGDHLGAPKEPEVIVVAFDKVNGSMGLSIVAAKVSDICKTNIGEIYLKRKNEV